MRLTRSAMIYFCVFSALTSAVSAISYSSKGANSGQTQDSRRVTLKVRRSDEIAKSRTSTTPESALAEIISRANPISVEQFAESRPNYDTGDRFERVRVIEFATAAEARDFIGDLSGSGAVEYVEPDYQLELFEVPNDVLFTYQWNLLNVGQEYFSVLRLEGDSNDVQTVVAGSAGADIKSTGAVVNSGASDVVVAIIDSGLDRFHPDLNGSVWQNVDELPANNVDDDHNGYIDDTWGWDYSANEASIPIYSDNDPNDTFGHGTHCAGIIGARINNNYGIAGVSKHAKLMPLKIFPTMSVSLAAKAVIYAADNGADVISMSWGMPYESLLLYDALQYAREKGVVLCAGSGNSGTEDLFYPAAFEFVIAVGATNGRDFVADFSTFGPHVELCAPGESILSLRAGSSDMYGVAPSYEPGVHIVADRFYEASGTSMACPHVAGVVAEMRAQSPGLSSDSIRRILRVSSDDLVDPRGEGTDHAGWDRFSGYGRVNLMRALEATPTTQARIDFPGEGFILSGIIEIVGRAFADGDGSYKLDYRRIDDTQWSLIEENQATVSSGELGTWDTGQLSGLYEIRLRVGEANESRRAVLLVPEATVELYLAENHEVLSGGADIGLKSICQDFERTVIDYRSSSSSADWVVVAELTAPSVGETSVFWDLMTVPNGDYVIRARVFGSNGEEDSFEEHVTVVSPFSEGRGWRAEIGARATIMANYGDFDGDGNNEIVVGTDSGLVFFDLSGNRRYAGMPNLPDENCLVVPAVCSIDSDSIDDLAVISETTNLIYGLASGGRIFRDVVYNSPRTSLYGSLTEAFFPLLFAQDLDHDGFDEIIYKSGGTLASPSQIRISSPKRTAGSCFPLELDGNLVQAADLDRDSLDELYVIGLNGLLRKINLCGETLRTISFAFGDYQLTPSGLTAADADGDGDYDLVLMGYLSKETQNFGYYILVMDSDLRVLRREARYLGIPGFLDPPMAVFGDIDGDGEPESVVSFHDANHGYLFAWNANGDPVLADQPMDGLIAAIEHPGIASMPLLVDVNNSNGPDAVVAVGRDLFGVFPRQRVEAFSATGDLLTGWPLFTAPHPQDNPTKANVPTFGDLDRDGWTDMIMITPTNELVFTSFPGSQWDEKKSPCPMWRYNRRLNNVAPIDYDVATAVESGEDQLPRDFVTAENFPNPFNAATTIEYSIPMSGDVNISIFNLSGQLVRRIFAPRQQAGSHQIRWEAVDQKGVILPSGVYFYQVESNNLRASGKMVLVK